MRLLALALSLVACGPTVLLEVRSDDGRREAVVLARDGGEHVRLDGARHPTFDAVAGLRFSEDGRRFAYAAKVDGAWAVVVDGRGGPRFDAVGEPRFLGPLLAYAARRRGKWHLVIDEGLGPAFDAIFEASITATPSALAYAGRRGAAIHAVVDGRLGPAHDAIGAFRVSPDGRVGYLAREGSSAFAVIDGRRTESHEAIADLTLGPAGRTALVVRREGGWSALIDGEAGPILRAISSVVFDETGSHHGYVGRDERERAHRDHEPGPPFEAVSELRLAGEHWAYLGRKDGRTHVMVDGRAVASPPWAGDLHLRKDGTPLYVARADDESMAVHEGERRHELDFVVEGTLVTEGLHWACVAGDRLDEELVIIVDGRPRRRLPEEALVEILFRDDVARLRRAAAAALLPFAR